MQRPPVSYIFAPELYGRLLWFGRLRWCAAVGLATASLLGSRFGVPAVWPSLFVIGVFVATYNALFLARLRSRYPRGRPYENLRVWAILQMVMDLLALLVTVHFTGGLLSPVLAFPVFHMAIGTIMIATRIMYMLAGATCVATFVLYVAEQNAMLAPPTAGPLGALGAVGPHFNMLSLVVLVFGVVYLTDSVMSRFKERSIELHERTEELRDRTAELQRLLEEREEVERRKAHYMRISAHQLRSPLGTIRTSLQVLVDGLLDPASGDGRRLLGGAVERVDDLLLIVNDLLELAKIRDGRVRAPWTRQVYLNQVLADIFDALEPFARERGVEVCVDFLGVAELDWGVPPDLVFAFENLIHNAIKYSFEGGKVNVSLRTAGDSATVAVTDRGIGIRDDLRDDVFLEFVRAPEAKRHAADGTGLGLSIVREAVEMHGGAIEVSSEAGAGTTFTVTMPLHNQPPAVARALRPRDTSRRA